jgi:ParB-like chromosome segregation protein Spo0J
MYNSPPGLIDKSGPFIMPFKTKEVDRMAKNEPNNTEDVKIPPENEQTEPVKEAPAPEMTTEEAATLTHEGEAALREMGEEQLEPSIPFDVSGEHIPDLDDVIVPSDKISETEQEVKPPAAPEKQEAEKSDKAPKKQARRNKAAPQEVQEAGAEDTRQEWEKPLSEVEPKKERKPRMEKQKPAAEKKEPAAPAPEPIAPQEPKEVPRKGEAEQIVFINLSELHAFKNHPFGVRDDEEMRAMVESVKDKGVTQPAIVRPREDGGYEIVSGHRRQKASELAGYFEMPCIVRNLTDEEAITQMVEDNTNQRESILPSERAKALKMQLEAIKRQGARADLSTSGQDGPKSENGQRSNAVVAERNKMTVKQVQRYIKLNDLVPDLMKMVDEKKISFTPAVEMSFIRPKNQRYIAVAIEGQQSAPSLSQAQRMRELDQKKILNADVIDGIMLEEKKEVDKVIISSQELSQYFGKEKTPREMKDTIIKLLDEWKEKQPELVRPEKKQEQEK